MIPPKAGEHFQAVIDVPADAYSLDFVFADVPGGDGTYDNRGGLDYHLPTTGSPTKENPMYVCHISVEMAPIAKVGGLGDVVTSLGRAVSDMGHYVEVVLPKYQFFNHSPLLQNMEYDCEFDWGGTKIFVTKAQVEGLQCFFIEPRNGMFNVDAVYGRYDDAVRFDFFCKVRTPLARAPMRRYIYIYILYVFYTFTFVYMDVNLYMLYVYNICVY